MVSSEALAQWVTRQQSRAQRLRKQERLDEAADLMMQVTQQLGDVVEGERGAEDPDLAEKLADSYGMLGGILRRQGNIEAAISAYGKGSEIEQDPKYGVTDSYNLTNSVVLRLLNDPNVEDHVPELRRAAAIVRNQVQGKRRNQWWAWADSGLLSTLLGDDVEAATAYEEFRQNGARASDFRSTISMLEQMRDALRPHDEVTAIRLNSTIERLAERMPT